MREVVRAFTLMGLEELVSELGGDLSAYADQIGFDLTAIGHPESFVPARKVHELTNFAAGQLKRKDLGLLWGARSNPARLGPLHVALTTAQTGRQALSLIARFLHVNFPTGAVIMKSLRGSGRELIAVRTHLRAPPPLIHFYERRVGSLHVILKLVCGRDYQPQEVWFTHEQYAPLSAYLRVFGIRPSFGMPENGLVISRGALDAVRPGANDQVREMAVSYLRSQAPPARDTVSAETFHMVRILMHSSNCTASQTARALGMHARTLQRRLRRERTSFEAIKDDVRRSMAESMLADSGIGLLEIALSLHYANMSSFTRSCHRWFGKPPSVVRRDIQKKLGKGARMETKIPRSRSAGGRR